jgi:hypothetical protein
MKKKFMICMISCLFGAVLFYGHAETVYYGLENVTLDDGTQLSGFISWTYTPDNFENGTNQFIYLDIPHSAHNQGDLIATIEPSQIEITFDGNVHDDGVDIKLVLLEPLTPFTFSSIDTNTNESKYSIGGNGGNDGIFLSGRVVPTNLTLNITGNAPDFVFIEWTPDMPGVAVLQETPNLSSNWVESASGIANSIVVPVITNAMFYRVVTP